MNGKGEKTIPFFRTNIPDWNVLSEKLEYALYNEPLNEGAAVYQFEDHLRNYLNAANLNAVSSGTAALHLALILAGVGEGDVVLSTSLTAEPTNTVIKSTGATIFYYDLCPISGRIDLDSIPQHMLHNAKALLVVHYGGYVQPMREICAIGEKYGIKIIEDCAHALGSTFEGAYCGTLGDYGCFSFQAIKQLTTIEGGAIICKDTSAPPLVKELRWFGLQKGVARYETNITRQGYKYNFNNINALIGILGLNTFSTKLKYTRSIASDFIKAIEPLKNIEHVSLVENSNPSYWLFTALIEKYETFSEQFDKRNISGGPIHKLNHTHSFLATDQEVKGAIEFNRKLFHIPIGPWLMEEEIGRIIHAINEADSKC